MDSVRNLIRGWLRHVAAGLNRLSGGRLSPDVVTIIGFLMHLPIAILIAKLDYNILAAVLLIIFGLFDTLDGELARLQKRDSPGGMLLDASTDRMKEVLLYAGIAYALIVGAHPTQAVWAVVALSASLCVSYVKAKGEAAVATAKKDIPHHQLNYMFKDGILAFEIRMVLLVVGLLVGQLFWAIVIIAVLASYTALVRLMRITRVLTSNSDV